MAWFKSVFLWPWLRLVQFGQINNCLSALVFLCQFKLKNKKFWNVNLYSELPVGNSLLSNYSHPIIRYFLLGSVLDQVHVMVISSQQLRTTWLQAHSPFPSPQWDRKKNQGEKKVKFTGCHKRIYNSVAHHLENWCPPRRQRHQSSMKIHIPVLQAQFCPFLTLWALTCLSLRRKASASSGDLKKTSQDQLPSGHCSFRFPP